MKERRKKDDGGHPDDERRVSTKCGCGKWNCGGDNTYMGTKCEHDARLGTHHTDGTQACETNHRSPKQQAKYEDDHIRWKKAQAILPNLAAVMGHLQSKANPLSFDGHDNFKFVVDHPEEAAICIHHMFDTLHRIQIGQSALAEIPTIKRR